MWFTSPLNFFLGIPHAHECAVENSDKNILAPSVFPHPYGGGHLRHQKINLTLLLLDNWVSAARVGGCFLKISSFIVFYPTWMPRSACSSVKLPRSFRVSADISDIFSTGNPSVSKKQSIPFFKIFLNLFCAKRFYYKIHLSNEEYWRVLCTIFIWELVCVAYQAAKPKDPIKINFSIKWLHCLKKMSAIIN